MTPQLVDIIKINKLTKKFGKVLALDEFDMSVRQVEVHGFLRPNGSSENTTIHILLGLLKSTGCQVYLLVL